MKRGLTVLLFLFVFIASVSSAFASFEIDAYYSIWWLFVLVFIFIVYIAYKIHTSKKPMIPKELRKRQKKVKK